MSAALTQWKINSEIPGWCREPIHNILAEYASAVPEDGTIIELGAMFGRSTYALGHNKKPSVELITIDIWQTYILPDYPAIRFHDNLCSEEARLEVFEAIRKGPYRLEGDDMYRLWKKWTLNIPNLVSFRRLTDWPNKDMPLADLIFHDAGHEYLGVKADLVRWWPKLKRRGILIIDDYEPQFPGLVKAVNEFVEQEGLKIEMLPTNRNVLIRKP